MRTHWMLVSVLLASAACGEDEPPPPPPRPAGAAAAKPKAAGKKGATLAARPKIETLAEVTDPERSTIRHTFRERDFIVDRNNPDPFQSFLLAPPNLDGANETLKRDPTKKCLRDDQFIAPNYSYTDLKLVGIIAERTQRRVLMMAGNVGVIIRKGDCVGREKALVKDIGAGYITFQVEPDDPTGQARPVEEHSVQLYPNQVPLSSQPRDSEPAPSTTPVVGPDGPVTPPRPAPQAPTVAPE